jgi:transcriptional regulator with XRE-family HTH domain
MNKLIYLREQANFTQEELSQKSGISVRTIQRIESGQIPKGYTLKALSNALGVEESFFLQNEENTETNQDEVKWSKILNFLTFPFIVIPPLNILVPLTIMFVKKQNTVTNRKLISIQILWSLIAIVLFGIVLILNDWLFIESKFKLLIPLIWLLINAIIIIRNAMELNKSSNPRILPSINLL